MDNNALAQLLFPNVELSPDAIEAQYPERHLPEGAKVTRMAPSPTGFMHLGNLYGAIADERLAHQSQGVFFLRIEDTDQKREVPGGVKMILDAFSDYGLLFDEGATLEGDKGAYGPYRQRQRAAIYHVFAKELVRKGRAYPCFCSEDELAEIRREQETLKENFGYYGKYALHRNLPFDEVQSRVRRGERFVIRFRSDGDPGRRVNFTDLVKGSTTFPENDQDAVLLKSDGIPTYHFAHVVDDHLMRVTHVVRGEEWLATLPIHLQLFEALGWRTPKYIHTAQLMKLDGTSKRKLSKRKDPELALSYYRARGYSVGALKEYLMTLLNSNFEEWRLKNKDEPLEKFPFSIKKMSASGALFDTDKLDDVSRGVISRMSAGEVYEQLCAWARQFDPDFAVLLARDPAYTKAILSIGRGGKNPRKDITVWSDAKEYVRFFFDELFEPSDDLPDNISRETAADILGRYRNLYDPADDNAAWFEKVKQLSEQIGFAADMKAFRQNPGAYGGNVTDVAMVIRLAVTGRRNSPDLCEVMALLGEARVRERLERACR